MVGLFKATNSEVNGSIDQPIDRLTGCPVQIDVHFVPRKFC